MKIAPGIQPQTVLDARQAMIAANQFIVKHLPGRFSAGLPKLVVWGKLPLRPPWLIPFQLIPTPSCGSSEGYLLRELRAAYLTMSEQERWAKVALAEERLWAQPDLAEAFPGEAEWPW